MRHRSRESRQAAWDKGTMQIAKNQKDLLAGLLFVFIGLAIALGTREFELGTARRMGPGYFPAMLSGILVLLGVIISIKSFFGAEERIGKMAWVPLAILVVAVLIFGLTVRGAGLVPATILLAAISLVASVHFKVRTAIVLSVTLALFSWLVFSYGLGLPMPPLGTWF
jgi:hypothetical protein